MNKNLPDQTLGALASAIPGATRIFHDFQLDFCCGGGKTLADAAQQRGLDLGLLLTALEALAADPAAGIDWRGVPPEDLIGHIVARFHERHRVQLPELIRLSRRVEHVHAGRPGCPGGLADALEGLQQELESHMMKEEQVLFPMLARGMNGQAQGPISVMRFEHEQHGSALSSIQRLTNNITPPVNACNTWRALYGGLNAFKEDLMQHIHLENNVLFLNASIAAEGAAHHG
ncbi:iron-sulfur cluster repair protein YtfE [Pollutimonas bauzanensis]|uniref:Regulator of cell morphogenesis and NO signaling n=1 Tax=Pollutimonas bauzanensis TaxID=658167 RepID=A0A1M5Z5U0_9BURK|nr:iron-sulfur cluster repair protein YtfE [Pollutimonas bauzanensis]SHI19645.1 regulator of cell morphogenesis and NO signaling [Pollutimonas bauzanensis]